MYTGDKVELSDLIGSLNKTKRYAELSKKLVSDTHTCTDRCNATWVLSGVEKLEH